MSGTLSVPPLTLAYDHPTEKQEEKSEPQKKKEQETKNSQKPPHKSPFHPENSPSPKNQTKAKILLYRKFAIPIDEITYPRGDSFL